MIYIITYETNAPLKNYSSLRKAIKNYPSWWHHIRNTWMIRTPQSAETVYNKLCKHINQSDRLIVIEVTPNYQGWLTDKAWKWIDKQFEKEGRI